MNPPRFLVIEDDVLIGGLPTEMFVSLGRDTAGIQMAQDEASLMPGIAEASGSTQPKTRSGIRAIASAPLLRQVEQCLRSHRSSPIQIPSSACVLTPRSPHWRLRRCLAETSIATRTLRRWPRNTAGRAP